MIGRCRDISLKARNRCLVSTWPFSLLKRWMLGTHQGSTAHKHLDDYLNEFVFRFNRRKSAHAESCFIGLLTVCPSRAHDL